MTAQDHEFDNSQEIRDLIDQHRIVHKSYLVIEFDPSGTIIAANENFLTRMGYELNEIVGQHHSMFCDERYKASPDYVRFWEDLSRGEPNDGTFKRVRKDGSFVWLRAAYTPLMADDGNLLRIIKIAMDVSIDVNNSNENAGRIAAIDRSQATIEFDLEGTILSVNDNFLKELGYSSDELIGKHHSMLCSREERDHPDYKRFWEKLARGEYVKGEYRRIAKDGHELWLHASYNPILDAEGLPIGIVKFASDITVEKEKSIESQCRLAAIDRSQAVIEFSLDGTVLQANRNFLEVMGYSPDDVLGKHHSMFCDPSFVKSADYQTFWTRLRRGEYVSGEFKRIGRGGREVWIQATYGPVLDVDGKPLKVIKYATDITAQKAISAEFESKINAIGRAYGIIEFSLSGEILEANANFLELMGYSRDEIINRHHRMLCDPAFVASDAYQDLWMRLKAGEFVSGEFRRVKKGGADVWISASYNPVLDSSGAPVKIVKFAMDVTEAKLRASDFKARIEGLDRSQGVIEFDLDGKVIAANENFLRVIGYSLREIIGQHHSMFCSPDHVRSQEYRDFWLKLNKGEHASGRFHRIGKYDRDVYIQATYSPIFDLEDRPIRVIKYAYDVTAQVELEQRISERSADMSRVVDALGSSIQNIVQQTGSATTLAEETQFNANQGFEALGTAITSIEQIQSATAEVADIVAIIGDLAGQTNVLAFNAAIEAARAGDHGVGFSVVADEVRKLAERSSEAAARIQKLIDLSSNLVGQGSERSQNARHAFAAIVESVRKTSGAISEISAAASSQKEVTDRVIGLITDLSRAQSQAA